MGKRLHWQVFLHLKKRGDHAPRLLGIGRVGRSFRSPKGGPYPTQGSIPVPKESLSDWFLFIPFNFPRKKALRGDGRRTLGSPIISDGPAIVDKRNSDEEIGRYSPKNACTDTIWKMKVPANGLN